MMRRTLQIGLLLALVLGASSLHSQTNPSLQTYFKDYIGLGDDQIAAIRSGQAFAKNLHSRTGDEIFVFGAVFIQGKPEDYVKFSRDFERLRKLPGYLAINKFSDPPQLSDLNGFTFDADDIKALQDCKPGDCQIQMPTSSIEALHQSVDLSAPDAEQQVNRRLQTTVLERLIAYQRQGNIVLGEYNDKKNPTIVPDQFKYMLSYTTALPRYLPDFYNYLLSYPAGEPANVENSFYWAKVKFGLKPTLRVVHVVTLRGDGVSEPAYTIAEKQLYSSHYFETALDLTFCVPEASASQRPGFYLIMTMGSEQAGLTGIKGSIVRKVAVDRSASSLQKSLAAIKSALEQSQ
ncbi:MAG TPA: hypothetical protein VEJ46_08605 [Candidatus Acidoferrum sp.]|nr:hypothetical protein [Candidatus Acidoferrum sp.]